VRSVVVATPSPPPSRLTSAKASAYSSLVIAGGGGTRNCSAERSTKGFTSAQCAERQRHAADRILPPVPSCIARDLIDAEHRLKVV
jgi:hypothetical protein